MERRWPSGCAITGNFLMKLSSMKKKSGLAARLLKMLSNQTRLLIVCRLTEGEASVGELADMLEMRPSTVSQHLQVLRLGKVVKTRRDAQTIYYTLDNNAASDVVRTLYKGFCQK